MPKTGAWASDTFKQLVDLANNTEGKQGQFDAITNVIGHSYKMRKQADYCQYGAKLQQDYLGLFDKLYQQDKSPFVDEKAAGHLHLATLLNDVGQFDQAISICQHALTHQLSDGTITGFEGRLVRIEKAKLKT